jgi:hypothetical protein
MQRHYEMIFTKTVTANQTRTSNVQMLKTQEIKMQREYTFQ